MRPFALHLAGTPVPADGEAPRNLLREEVNAVGGALVETPAEAPRCTMLNLFEPEPGSAASVAVSAPRGIGRLARVPPKAIWHARLTSPFCIAP